MPSQHEPPIEPPLPADSPEPAADNRGRSAAIFLIIAGLLVIWISAVWAMENRSIPSQLPEIGRPLSDFHLPDLNGQLVSLSDYQGRPVLINFWGTWCPPCRAEMPDLESFYQQHQGEGLVVLGINNGDSETAAAEFVEAMGISFPILLDEAFAVADGWMVNNLPTTILIGRDGLVKVIHVGLYRAEQMDKELVPHLAP
jgi:peroxiredoxin